MDMYDVYISCSQTNILQAVRFLHLLEGKGLSCRMTRHQALLSEESLQEIRGSGSVIAVITGNSEKDRLFLEELEAAAHSGKTILPLVLDDCRITTELRFLIGGEPPLIAFRMDEDSLVQQLIMRLRMNGTRTQAPAEPQPAPPAQKFNLKLIREKQFFAVDVAIKAMTEDGTTHRVKNGTDVTVSVPAGKQVIQFTGSFRKTKVELDISRDTALLLKWNRWTGHIDVESIAETNLKILQKRKKTHYFHGF